MNDTTAIPLFVLAMIAVGVLSVWISKLVM